MAPVYAHTLDGRPESEWETLEKHLREVGEMAAEFASSFGARDWGLVAGWWHDLGKARPEFQARLRGERLQAEHAGAGAALAYSKGKDLALPIAFVVAGHHSGLANLQVQEDTSQLPLIDRVRANLGLIADLKRLVAPELTEVGVPTVPTWIDALLRSELPREERRRRVRLAFEMFTRFLFSALVDADRLCTERFYQGAGRPPGTTLSPGELLLRLDAYIDALQLKADPSTVVNRMRTEVLAACRRQSTNPKGLFSLTVPTGGGKTLAAMAFALGHAAHNELRRVIVVIPYTSIIEQNAAVYREALGADVVVEHHSNLDEESATEVNPEKERARRHATENWDAPVIVTTSVQFFETLFSNHPSRCRKLHNVARSVLLLDEVQTLPPGLLIPILDGLSELRERYGCSVVMATASPPALRWSEGRPYGLREVKEIVPDPGSLAREQVRVRVHWPSDPSQSLSFSALAERLRSLGSALAVVHQRRDARELASLLPPHSRCHLSASMCPAHRLHVLHLVRRRLAAGEPCLLVSTQLVEAGVDIDFPVVYRAMAGLDSLTQAAGRCNREGRRRDADGRPCPGDFFVFRAETKPPPGVLRMAQETAEAILSQRGSMLVLQDPDASVVFFDRLYFKSKLDDGRIQGNRESWNFATVARDFRLIDDYMWPVVVPYGDATVRLGRYRRRPTRETRRALQPHTVSVTPAMLSHLDAIGALERVDDAVIALLDHWKHLYDDEFGLIGEIADERAGGPTLIA